MMLTDDDLLAAEQRARRFQGAYTGTSGALAADSLRQIQFIRHLQQENAMTLNAVTDTEYESQPIPSDWILRGERELKAGHDEPRPLGAGVLAQQSSATNESEALLLEALAAVRDRRQTYGPPRDHFAITAGLVNAAFGTTFSAADWAVVMILDKVARSRGPSHRRDNWTDIAGYAACRSECENP